MSAAAQFALEEADPRRLHLPTGIPSEIIEAFRSLCVRVRQVPNERCQDARVITSACAAGLLLVVIGLGVGMVSRS